MKKIMILTSAYTGHGHKSISDALISYFKPYEDVELDVVEAFSLIGSMGVKLSKMYGPMTRTSKDLWKILYSMSNRSDRMLTDFLGALIHDRFMKRLAAFHPDLILTVHPMFNGSVLNLLEHYQLNVPFIALQADIINIHKTWCDPRADMTLCPTQEAYQASIAMGMSPERLRACGFPTRAQFCEAARDHVKQDYDGSRPFQCLLMSGGEGSGNMRRYAVELLNHFNCHVNIICGRNVRLRQSLEQHLSETYGDRVSVYGFVNNVQDFMLDADIVIARGSPNSMMEAVVCNTPLVITGSLPGQEADNPTLMVQHGLGVLCPEPAMVNTVISHLIMDGGKRMREIREAQLAYRNLDNAKEIVRYLYETTQPAEYDVPTSRRTLGHIHPRKLKRMIDSRK